jgi:hypothetical protein
MIGPEPSLVWGWPWRGLGSNYTITGHTGNVFRDCQSWLIDLGLPAISLTAAETTEATANGYTWQNYGHVSGGYVYGVDIQQNGGTRKDTFIHVDGDDRLWRVRLEVSISGDNVDITCRFKPFGEFGYGELTQQTVVKSVSCAEITPTVSPTREWSIADAKTNGAACLVEIRIVSGSFKDIYSVIELTPTVTAGVADFSAFEVFGGAETTATSSTPSAVYVSPARPSVTLSTACGNILLTAGGGTHNFVYGSLVNRRYAVAAYYDSAGMAHLVRFREADIGSVSFGGYVITEGPTPPGGCGEYTVSSQLSGTIYSGTSLQIEVDGVAIATFKNEKAVEKLWNSGNGSVYCFGSECADNGGSTWFNNPSDLIGGSDVGTTNTPGFGSGLPNSFTTVINGIRSRTYLAPTSTSTDLIDLSSTVIGTCGAVFAPPSLLAFWYKPTGSDVVLSTWAAPISATYTGSLATVPSVYWAWNRKTNAYTFSTLPVCYV